MKVMEQECVLKRDTTLSAKKIIKLIVDNFNHSLFFDYISIFGD